MAHAILTVDLGYGDSGKGTIVESLVRRHKASLVVRYSGGAQCAHNVILADGRHHTFAQFGAGTFAGAHTLLTNNVLVDPVRLMNEGEVLKNQKIHNPFHLMHVDAEALVITPFHCALNRLKEKKRGDKRHGSCGIGIGETRAYALRYPDRALKIGDLLSPAKTREKLEQIKADLLPQLNPLVESGDWMMTADCFTNPYLMDALLWRYHVFKQSVGILSHHATLTWLNGHETTVWEGAQGTLIDEDYGFHPHTTWSRVTLDPARELLREAGISESTSLGITRAYACRHGAGPFPTEAPELLSILPESHNKTDTWQGGFRVGWFDLMATKYALRINKPDLLAVTHCDRLNQRRDWRVISEYPLTDIHPDNFAEREEQTQRLMRNPLETHAAHNVNSEDFIPFLSKELKLPVKITSYGPTHEDKTYHG